VYGVIAESANSYVDAAPSSGNGSSWALNGKELPFAARRLFRPHPGPDQAGHLVGAIQPYTPITEAFLIQAGGRLCTLRWLVRGGAGRV
jgi:hypothetical protein